MSACKYGDPTCPCQDGDACNHETLASEWAWFAGIFEGEGCIDWNSKNSVRLEVKMTDGDIIERLRLISHVGTIRAVPRPPPLKTAWSWRVTNKTDVLHVLDHIHNYLGIRRSAKAVLARERMDGMRKLGTCKRGHVIAGDNVYIRPDNQRRFCRICQVTRDAARDYKTERAIRSATGRVNSCATTKGRTR